MNPYYWIAVAVVGVLSAARLTRLATVDKFPPVKAVRTWYENKTDGTDWIWLVLCGYCFSFWATLVVSVWALLAGVLDGPDESVAEQVWWFANGTFGLSYLAAIVMAHDGDNGDGEDD